jgi:cytochrome P450
MTGMLSVEDDEHKHQRRILNPAFGPVQMRPLTGAFVLKAFEVGAY